MARVLITLDSRPLGTGVGNSTEWFKNGTRKGSHHNITQLNDQNNSNNEFTVGEALKATYYNDNGTYGGIWDVTYEGTYEFNGVKYPVVSQTVGTDTVWWVVGLRTNATENSSATGDISRNHVDENFSATGQTICFFPGTLLSTPSGERKVEDLVPGDPVLIGEGCTAPTTWTGRMWWKLCLRLGVVRAVPVKWIGRQTVSTRFGPVERLMPVRFAVGSLGGGGQPLIPHRQLTVTADHAVLVDGVLCEAGTLVNGTTITRVPLSEFGESYTVYHVETETHEIVLANGAPAETFVDNVPRRAFDNYAEYEKFYGDQLEMKELPHPRASNARHLPKRIRIRLGIGAKRESVA